MSTWTIAAVQMDCQLGEAAANRIAIETQYRTAVTAGAKLVVCPECILSGYGFATRAEAFSVAESIPGPTTEHFAKLTQELGAWLVFGQLERDGNQLYNTVALIGPDGSIQRYRKIHLPCVGVDRFTDPGNEPLRVIDLGGLKLGIGICFDGSFPEVARILTLQGADLMILPTNWADKALKMATLVSRVRAFENHIYHMAVNRIGDEAGYHYIGRSSIVDVNGEFLAISEDDQATILTATIDPLVARQKKVVHCTGEYEIDRVAWRRPEMYGPLVDTPGQHRD